MPARARVRPAVHVRRGHPDLPELLRAELQELPSDPAEAPEPEVQLQPQSGEPGAPERRSCGPRQGAVRPAAGLRRCVETLVERTDIHLPCIYCVDDVHSIRNKHNVEDFSALGSCCVCCQLAKSTDLKETEVSKRNPLWGFKDTGCR